MSVDPGPVPRSLPNCPLPAVVVNPIHVDDPAQLHTQIGRVRSWDGRHVDSTPRNDGRGLQGACRWVQPSTAAAVTLTAIAANVWSSATTRGKIRSLKRPGRWR